MKNVYLIFCITLTTAMMSLSGCKKSADQEENISVETAQDMQSEVLGEAAGRLPEEQKHALAFGAVLATRNSMNYDTIVGMDQPNKEDFIQVLKDDWSIVDRESAIKKLEWLKMEGRHISSDPSYFGYDEIYTSIIQGTAEDFTEEAEAFEDVYSVLQNEYGYTPEELNSITTVSAWDYDCLVVVARWSYLCEYITEGEAWSYIYAASEKGAKDYSSWRTYFAGVLFGRAIWAEEEGFDVDNKAIADHLLLNSNSIYQSVNFK